MTHPMKNRTAIVGLGITEMGRVYRSASDLACEAVFLALKDAGLNKSELDGLLINAGLTNSVGLQLHTKLGMQELNLLTFIQGYGSSAGQMIQYASMAIANGMADYVACVFADNPLTEGKSAGASYSRARQQDALTSINSMYGVAGANGMYALAAQRHMDTYGTTQEQLGAVAISQRTWAGFNERATKREPLNMDDYLSSPWVVEPFHVLDCCLVSNGAVAVIVTSADRAKDLAQPPAYVRGFAQAHSHDNGRTDRDSLLVSPAARSKERAFSMAEATLEEVSQCQLYDCYTYTVLVTLEDYGFCRKGEGGPFIEEGHLAPGGSLPTNTGGGELSSFYMWGMTPLTEGVIQARGQGEERQQKNDLILVTGNGGILNYHSTLLLSPHAA